MAGSYNHVVKEDGNLESNQVVVDMLETGGDVFETVEEMYGMIWYLANALGKFTQGQGWNPTPDDIRPEETKMLVEQAREHYKDGLRIAEEVNKT